MQTVIVQALRSGGRTLAHATVPRAALSSTRSFLISPSYKARVAITRGYATATATKKTATKKPAAKKTTKTAAKKPATKAKAKPKAKTAKKAAPKKKVAKKPVAAKKKKVARPVDPEKARVQLRRALKKTALLNQDPPRKAGTSWTVFVDQNLKGSHTGTPTEFGSKIKDIAAAFKSLTPAEKQRYEQMGRANQAAYQNELKKFVESHSITEIIAANNARRRLVRDFKIKLYPVTFPDERYPKRPVTSFAYFLKARMGNSERGELTLKDVCAEWKTLSASEKKPYEDLTAADMARYKQEVERLGL